MSGCTSVEQTRRAQGVIAEHALRRFRRRRHEALCAAADVVLPRVTLQIDVELGRSAIEALSVVMCPDRRFQPRGEPNSCRGSRSCAALTSRFGGSVGFSSRSRTSRLSRSVSSMCSEEATMLSARGRAARMTKVVRSIRSSCAARSSRAFSAGEARNSIRSDRIVLVCGIGRHPPSAQRRLPYVGTDVIRTSPLTKSMQGREAASLPLVCAAVCLAGRIMAETHLKARPFAAAAFAASDDLPAAHHHGDVDRASHHRRRRSISACSCSPGGCSPRRAGRSAFETANAFFGSWFGRLILFGFTWALHPPSPRRHPASDLGHRRRLFGSRCANGLAWATIVGSVVLTLVVWIIGYARSR